MYFFIMKNRPVLILSACLAGRKTRYNGKSKAFCDPESFAPYFAVKLICPEISAGLGVPREPFHITQNGRAVFNLTNADLTEKLQKGIAEIISSLQQTPPAAAILKSRSPSCGPDYGLFALELKKHFPGIKIYTEEDPEAEKLPGFRPLNN